MSAIPVSGPLFVRCLWLGPNRMDSTTNVISTAALLHLDREPSRSRATAPDTLDVQASLFSDAIKKFQPRALSLELPLSETIP